MSWLTTIPQNPQNSQFQIQQLSWLTFVMTDSEILCWCAPKIVWLFEGSVKWKNSVESTEPLISKLDNSPGSSLVSGKTLQNPQTPNPKSNNSLVSLCCAPKNCLTFQGLVPVENSVKSTEPPTPNLTTVVVDQIMMMTEILCQCAPKIIWLFQAWFSAKTVQNPQNR